MPIHEVKPGDLLTTSIWNELVKEINLKADHGALVTQLQEITTQSGATGADIFKPLEAIEQSIKTIFAKQLTLEAQLSSLETIWQQKNAFPQAPEMVFIKGGTFKMCHPTDPNQPRVREVTVSDFSIGKYPVTQAQWVAIMGTYPFTFMGDNLPVENVTWQDANLYIFRLSQKTGKKYRLPTEAEWEYAALGQVPYDYPGSPDGNEVSWHKGNADGQTRPVGLKKPNGYGLYDMAGNVWEMCSDWYGNYNNTPVTNPIGAISGGRRIIRGGSWEHGITEGRTTFRSHSDPSAIRHIGFRVVLGA